MIPSPAITKWRSRPLSWSQIASWQFSKEQWHRKYIQGIIDPPNSAMLYGNIVGAKLAEDPSYLPDVLRYKQFEKKLEAKIGETKLVGFIDSFCPDTKAFYEFKTSGNKRKWTKKSAQEHGQILFYMFLIWKNYGVLPEDVKCKLFYIPVGETGSFEMEVLKEPIQNFEVKHTTVEVLHFAKYIQDVVKEMELFANSKLE